MAAEKLKPGTKLERKYLAHFVDEGFGAEPVSYKRLGKDLEDYSVNFNYSVDPKNNIIGDNSLNVQPPKLDSSASTYYAEKDDKIAMRLFEAGMEGSTENLRTTVVDAVFDADGACIVAYKHDCIVTPESAGGDTSGVNIPFKVTYAGNTQKGTFDLKEKTFSPAL